MRLLQIEVYVLFAAYVMTSLPVVGFLVLGRVSPAFDLPRGVLLRWWSRFALPMAIVYIATLAPH